MRTHVVRHDREPATIVLFANVVKQCIDEGLRAGWFAHYATACTFRLVPGGAPTPEAKMSCSKM